MTDREQQHGGSTRNHEAEPELIERKSMRAHAREMGVSHTELWRWCLMAEIPDAELEQLLANFREAGKPPTTRAIADYARRRRGDWIPEDIENCPHCGEPIRRRA